MKQVSLSGVSRAHVGKVDARTSRNEDLVPAVVYGGKEQKHIKVPYIDLHKILYSADVYQINLTVDGATYPTIVREIQFHPVTDKVIHVDFLELIPGKEVVVEIPLKFVGTSPGVLAGGKLVKNMRKVKVKASVENMPESVTVDISSLNLGSTLKIKQIELKGAKLVDTPERAVAAVNVTRNTQAAAADAPAGAKAAPAKK